jgi:hypothetical protein
MMYDEYANLNLTNMVDRVIYEQGDPRFFLAELKNNRESMIISGGPTKVVFLHRLPHMKLNKKI